MRTHAFYATLALTLPLVFAAPVLANDEHHPEKAAATPPAAAAPAPQASPATVKKMQDNLGKMQSQLDRASRATTDEERQKAMAEHMQTMQENMRLATGEMAGAMNCADMHGRMMGSGSTKPAM